MFSRWTFAIYSGPSCNFPEPREADTFLGGIDRLTILRVIAPIRFSANKITARYEPSLCGVNRIKRLAYAPHGGKSWD
jgi:hypothetical protein